MHCNLGHKDRRAFTAEMSSTHCRNCSKEIVSPASWLQGAFFQKPFQKRRLQAKRGLLLERVATPGDLRPSRKGGQKVAISCRFMPFQAFARILARDTASPEKPSAVMADCKDAWHRWPHCLTTAFGSATPSAYRLKTWRILTRSTLKPRLPSHRFTSSSRWMRLISSLESGLLGPRMSRKNSWNSKAPLPLKST